MKKIRCYIALCLPLWLSLPAATQQPTAERAANFAYRKADGTRDSLSTLRTDWVLLYFYNPECEDCHAMMQQLDTLTTLVRLQDTGRLTVLAVYPEDDTTLWRAHLDAIPARWRCGYDDEIAINSLGLYPMTSLPALFLLDRERLIRLRTDSFNAIRQALEQLNDKH